MKDSVDAAEIEVLVKEWRDYARHGDVHHKERDAITDCAEELRELIEE